MPMAWQAVCTQQAVEKVSATTLQAQKTHKKKLNVLFIRCFYLKTSVAKNVKNSFFTGLLS